MINNEYKYKLEEYQRLMFIELHKTNYLNCKKVLDALKLESTINSEYDATCVSYVDDNSFQLHFENIWHFNNHDVIISILDDMLVVKTSNGYKYESLEGYCRIFPENITYPLLQMFSCIEYLTKD